MDERVRAEVQELVGLVVRMSDSLAVLSDQVVRLAVEGMQQAGCLEELTKQVGVLIRWQAGIDKAWAESMPILDSFQQRLDALPHLRKPRG